MATSRRRPRGRRPGTPGTKEQILVAARVSFGTTGFAGTSLRTIATAAGVDVALIAHYFGTKRELFDRVVAWDDRDGDALQRAVEHEAGGAAIVRGFLELYDARSGGETLGALLRAAADDAAAQRLVGELVARTIVEPVRARLDRSRSLTRLRAEAVAAQLAGLAWSRYVLRREPIALSLTGPVSTRGGPGDRCDSRRHRLSARSAATACVVTYRRPNAV